MAAGRRVLVESLALAQAVEWELWGQDVVAVDTETVGCDPGSESPVGRARVWCMTLAWGDPEDPSSAFVPADYLSVFRDWLQSSRSLVFAGGYDYDRHVLRNEGIEIAPLLGDSWLMSKLLNPSSMLLDGRGHDLKSWGARLGYEMRSFEDVAGRQKPGAVRTYKQTRRVVKDGVPTLYVEGAEAQNFSTRREVVPLPELWRDYPQRRPLIVDYACRDAVVLLRVFWELKRRLEGTQWR